MVIVVPAPLQSPAAHIHPELGGNTRGSFPAPAGRGGVEEAGHEETGNGGERLT